MFKLAAFAVLLCVLSFCESQEKARCDNKTTCSDCIQELGCVWCSEKNTTSRCRNEIGASSDWCPLNKITNPKGTISITTDNPLQSGIGSESVQIKPQRVKLSLRKDEEYRLSFEYAQAKSYPIDLYYIMDLSASMKAHKNQLANLGGQLVQVMRNITTNFRLGFGSFVDKVDMPFVNLEPKKLQNPCGNEDCVKAYSYINHLSLTDNYDRFSREVRQAKLSGNLDSPEGGFDALMQAIVCKDTIGWRSQARHLIVFSTDADFHTAGDGKLAGVVEPNDALCHLTDDVYIGDLVYDYPSISQINQVAKENNINIIFAIVKNEIRVYRSYEQLQQNIENSGVGELEEGSANVVDLILDNYNKIADSVRITDNSSSAVEIKYQPTCPHPTENGCNNIPVGTKVGFTATVKPLECKKGTSTETIQIKPEGINEALMVELEIICDCPCEKPGHEDYISGSPACNGNGDLKCAVCGCKSGTFGNNCECTKDSSTSTDDSQCKADPNKAEVCSGTNRGECKCGKCECKKKENVKELIYGKFCQCDNYSCKRNGGLVCSGPEKGSCDCGVCECLAGWTGDACECPNSNSTCIAPSGDGSVCSGHGNCDCGLCQCSFDELKYYGTYCEECLSCTGQRCAELLPCVECLVYKSGEYDENACRSNCTQFVPEVVDKIEEDNEEDERIKTCRVLDKYKCKIIFQYSSSSTAQLSVRALRDKICPEPVNILAVVLWVIFSIVVAGLIALAVWKLFTIIHDHREYARFVNEKKNTKFQSGENPLYKQATSTFTNPAYKQS